MRRLSRRIARRRTGRRAGCKRSLCADGPKDKGKENRGRNGVGKRVSPCFSAGRVDKISTSPEARARVLAAPFALRLGLVHGTPISADRRHRRRRRRQPRRAVERLDDRAVGRLPHPDLAVAAARGDQRAVRADGHGVDVIGVARQRPHRGAAVLVPEAHRVVGAGRRPVERLLGLADSTSLVIVLPWPPARGPACRPGRRSCSTSAAGCRRRPRSRSCRRP